MPVFYGANNRLEQLVKTHLFIICATNSGTTLLKNVLATSDHTWNLPREGQQTFGFKGPRSSGKPTERIWASDEKVIESYTDPESYNWSSIRQAWYFQAYSRDGNASVFVQKSPHFLLIVDELVKNFPDIRFLFMVRNPYAVVEGIRRRSSKRWRSSQPESELLTATAKHVVNCLKFQRKNIERWQNRGVFFSYEQMCEQPEVVEQMIMTLVPKIDDLVLSKRVQVREYNEGLRNMNQQQIDRLNSDDLRQINEVFSSNIDVISHFSYSIIS